MYFLADRWRIRPLRKMTSEPTAAFSCRLREPSPSSGSPAQSRKSRRPLRISIRSSCSRLGGWSKNEGPARPARTAEPDSSATRAKAPVRGETTALPLHQLEELRNRPRMTGAGDQSPDLWYVPDPNQAATWRAARKGAAQWSSRRYKEVTKETQGLPPGSCPPPDFKKTPGRKATTLSSSAVADLKSPNNVPGRR